MSDTLADRENGCHLWVGEYCVTVSKIAAIKCNYNSSSGPTTWSLLYVNQPGNFIQIFTLEFINEM
jgi:hypothetical protein